MQTSAPLPLPPTIAQRQQQLVEEFATLQGSRTLLLQHPMALGQQLPAVPQGQRSEANAIEGCLSRVWLTHSLVQGRLVLGADSDALITKGLLSLLVRLFSGQKPADILSAALTFMKASPLGQLIGAQRRSGFDAAYRRIRVLAKAYSQGRAA